MTTFSVLKDLLFVSCRRGDLHQVRACIEGHDMPVNVYDEWNASPLYHASLCGHMAIVEYLLHQGARCEENTFDGERCHYAALNDDIRRVLRQFKTVRARDPFSVFLRKCLQDVREMHPDLLFEVHGVECHVHRCILACRCEYFHTAFGGKWKDQSKVRGLHERLTVGAFVAFVRYLYTGRLELATEDLRSLADLCKQCSFPALSARAQQLHGDTEDEWIIEDPPTADSIAADLSCIAIAVLEYAGSTPCEGGAVHQLRCEPAVVYFPDVCFEVGDCAFPCHQVFFRGRSEFFNTLFCGSFSDMMDHDQAYSDESLPVIHLTEIKPEVFVAVVEFLYTNTFRLTSPALFAHVFEAADAFLLPELKAYCVGQAAGSLDDSNVYDLYQFAQLVSCLRLEEECTKYMATHLLRLVEQPEFHEQVVASCQSIQNRQDIDSCPLVDEIRCHISNRVGVEVKGRDSPETGHIAFLKFVAMDELLDRLRLEL